MQQRNGVAKAPGGAKVLASRKKAEKIRRTMQGISEVLPYLMISGASPAKDAAGLKELGVTHVIISAASFSV